MCKTKKSAKIDRSEWIGMVKMQKVAKQGLKSKTYHCIRGYYRIKIAKNKKLYFLSAIIFEIRWILWVFRGSIKKG